jgi:ankyrin repeat protein
MTNYISSITPYKLGSSLRVSVLVFLLFLACYSSLSSAQQDFPNTDVHQSLLKKLQTFATKTGMQVPTDLQDKDALIKLAQKITRNKKDLKLSPEETQIALQIMQSFSGQLVRSKNSPLSTDADTNNLSQDDVLKQRIAAMAAEDKNPMANQMMALLKQQQSQNMQEFDEEEIEQEEEKQHIMEVKNNENPLLQRQRMADEIAAAAGKMREQSEKEIYSKLPIDEKLAFILDKEKAPQLTEVKELLTQGAKINHVPEFTKETALHLAAKHGHLQIVKYLVEKGANTKLYNFKGYTAGQLAERSHYDDVAEFLDPNKEDSIPRYHLTRVQIVGNWQNIENPNDTLRFRKDLTVRINTDSGYEEKKWDPSKTNRNQNFNLVVIFDKKPEMTVTGNGVINSGSSARGHSREILHTFENGDLIISAGNTNKRYVRVAVEGDDMIRRKRENKESIKFDKKTAYSNSEVNQ